MVSKEISHPPIVDHATFERAQTLLKRHRLSLDIPQLERYRAALDAGADPSIVSGWIVQTQAERVRAEADLHAAESAAPRRMSQTDTALVRALGDIVAALGDADPADKAEVYRQLGLRLTYQPETQTVHAEADLSAHRGPMGRVRGATSTTNP